jgi:hypothetical protein
LEIRPVNDHRVPADEGSFVVSYYIYEEISCSKADKKRLKTALKLLERIHTGHQPASLPSALAGGFGSVEEFKERLAGRFRLYVEYEEVSDGIFINQDDVDLDGFTELLRGCLLDSLPLSMSWVFEGGLGGASAIFADLVSSATTEDLERLLMKGGVPKDLAIV